MSWILTLWWAVDHINISVSSKYTDSHWTNSTRSDYLSKSIMSLISRRGKRRRSHMQRSICTIRLSTLVKMNMLFNINFIGIKWSNINFIGTKWSIIKCHHFIKQILTRFKSFNIDIRKQNLLLLPYVTNLIWITSLIPSARIAAGLHGWSMSLISRLDWSTRSIPRLFTSSNWSKSLFWISRRTIGMSIGIFRPTIYTTLIGTNIVCCVIWTRKRSVRRTITFIVNIGFRAQTNQI